LLIQDKPVSVSSSSQRRPEHWLQRHTACETRDIIIEGQEAHNSIADQLLKDERIMGAMQGMLAKMVFQAFAQRGQLAGSVNVPGHT
jgi:DNA-binding transcriptional regulator YbjK